MRLMQSWVKEFHLSTVRLLNAYFLMSSLLRFLNNLLGCPPPVSISKNNDCSTLSIPFMILKVCIESLLTLLVVRRNSPKFSSSLRQMLYILYQFSDSSWTPSLKSISLLRYGLHTWQQYGLTRLLYSGMIVSFDLFSRQPCYMMSVMGNELKYN